MTEKRKVSGAPGREPASRGSAAPRPSVVPTAARQCHTTATAKPSLPWPCTESHLPVSAARPRPMSPLEVSGASRSHAFILLQRGGEETPSFRLACLVAGAGHLPPV